MSRRAAQFQSPENKLRKANQSPHRATIEIGLLEKEIRFTPNRPLSFHLRLVTERVSLWSGAEGAAIALSDAWGLVCRASTGEAPDVGSCIQPESSLSRECFENGQVKVSEGADQDPLGHAVGNSRFRSVVVVPIQADRQVLGIIGIFSPRTHAFREEQVRELQLVARWLAPVVKPDEQSIPAKKKQAGWFFLAGGAFLLAAVCVFLGFRQKSTPSLHLSIAPGISVAQNAVGTTASSTRAQKSETKREDFPKDVIKEDAPLKAASSAMALPANRTAVPEKTKSPVAESPYGRAAQSSTPPLVIHGEGRSSVDQKSIAASEPRGQAKIPVFPLALPPAVPIANMNAVIPHIARREIPNFVQDRSVKGHSGSVTGVAFSNDGRWMASGSWDQTVKLWDIAKGSEPYTLATKTKELQALTFAPDGQFLAAENMDDAVTLWSTVTGQKIRMFSSDKPLGRVGSSWVYSIAFSPDGRWLASGVDDKTVRVWDVNSGRVIRDFVGGRRSVIYAAFSPNGRWLATGWDDKTIKIWDVATGKEIQTLQGHKKNIYAVAFSPNGKWIASASADKTVKIWNLETGREMFTLSGHRGDVTSIAFSPDGRWLASGSWDKSIKIWDVQTGRELQTLEGNADRVYSVAFDLHGNRLASGNEEGIIKLWRLESQ